jgi:hypothetical protein
MSAKRLYMPRTLSTPLKLARSRIRTCNSFSQLSPISSAAYSTLHTKGREPSLAEQLTAYLHHQQPSRIPRSHSPNRSRKMSFLLPGLRRGLLLSTPLVLSAPLLIHQYRYARPIYCDSADPLTKITGDLTRNYSSEAKTPIITESGAANPRAIRQVSMGSILGVFCGLGISVFSKPLAILIGLGIFVLQVSQEYILVEP